MGLVQRIICILSNPENDKSTDLFVGDSGSPCADRWCSDSCSDRLSKLTIFYVVRQIRLHPRERFILLDIEIHGGEGLHLLLLQLLQWLLPLQLSLSLNSHSRFSLSHTLHTLTLLSTNMPPL